MYKPGASCCFGEMPLPAGVPSSQKGEQCHGRNLSRAFNEGQRCPIFRLIIHILAPFTPLILLFFFLSLRFCFSSVGSLPTWRDWWKLRNCSVSSSVSHLCGTRPVQCGDTRPLVSSRLSLLWQQATLSHVC